MNQKKNIIKKFPIKIKSNGDWLYKNNLIKKEALIKLFSSVLVVDKKNNFYLETPAEKGQIEVEDAPFVIKNFEIKNVNNKQEISFKTNIGEEITLHHKLLGDFNENVYGNIKHIKKTNITVFTNTKQANV